MIYMIGGSGGPNYGDDLILSLWIKYYRETGYEGPIIVDCLSRVNSEKIHDDFSDVYFVSNFKNLAKGRDGGADFYIKKTENIIHEKVEQLKDVINKLMGWKCLFNKPDIKLVHVFGGGYINGVWPNSVSLLAAAVAISKKYKCPCCATGLGISPITHWSMDDKVVMKKIISEFDVFELRDIQSYNEISNIPYPAKNVIFGLDDTFIFPVEKVTRQINRRVLHISGYEKAYEKFGLNDEVARVLNDFGGGFDDICFWGCNQNDLSVFEKFKYVFKDIKYFDVNFMVNNQVPIGLNDLMLTSRFHPHLIAARAGASGYYVANSGFYRAKHSSICDLGSDFKAWIPGKIECRIFDVNPLSHRDAYLVRIKQELVDCIINALKEAAGGSIANYLKLRSGNEYITNPYCN